MKSIPLHFRARTTVMILGGTLAVGASHAQNATSTAAAEVTAPEVVSAIESVFGVTPGQRRNHTKGVCATGEFVGNPEIATYSRATLFSGKPVPVIARFSLAGGNPKAPDTARSPRGMALEFKLPDGGLQHMTMLNTPMFGAALPKTFLDLMQAQQPDPRSGKPDPEKIKAFQTTHPDNKAQADYLQTHNPPASYAGSAYYGIHTFKFINAGQQITLVRWQFVPRDGEHVLSDEDMKRLGPNFLDDALFERVRRGLVQWDMLVTIGEPGDTETDPTRTWPTDRRTVRAGTLSISAAMPQHGAPCEGINYDPLVMIDGIAPTQDPILLFRSAAYAVSFGKRLTGQ
jgi:catalase